MLRHLHFSLIYGLEAIQTFYSNLGNPLNERFVSGLSARIYREMGFAIGIISYIAGLHFVEKEENLRPCIRVMHAAILLINSAKTKA